MRQLEATTHTVLDRLCGMAAGPIGIGVSGGSDSVALLMLAANWAARGGHQLLVLTFDHRLRPEAAAEAASVTALSARLGIPHQTLRWSAPKPAQAEARMARHSALATALRAAGGTHLLLGHTGDDQCETFLMRARKGSAWWGLAGMQPLSPSPVWPEGRGIVIARPLLTVRREQLRGFLRENDTSWHDDPSNQDRRYERVRMRAVLAGMPGGATRIDHIMSSFGGLRRVISRQITYALTQYVTCHADGLVSCAPPALQLPAEAQLRLLSILIQCAAGHARALDRAGLEALVQDILSHGLKDARTLGGAWIAIRKDQLVLARDPGLAGQAGWQANIWDGRFERRESGGSCAPLPADAHPMARPGLPPANIPARCIIAGRLATIGTILA